jgi:hypothetical protein
MWRGGELFERSSLKRGLKVLFGKGRPKMKSLVFSYRETIYNANTVLAVNLDDNKQLCGACDARL